MSSTNGPKGFFHLQSSKDLVICGSDVGMTSNTSRYARKLSEGVCALFATVKPSFRFESRSVVVAALALALVLAAPTPSLSRDLRAAPAGAMVSTSFSVGSAVATLNGFRQRHGLPAVSADPVLMQLAAQQARAMAAHDLMSHEVAGDVRGRLHGAGYRSLDAAENICAGYDTFADAFGGWVNSSGHRANMLLEGATRMGIAVAAAPPNARHRLYWSMILAQPAGTRPKIAADRRSTGAKHRPAVKHAQAPTSVARPD
jgi:uncharacterized protein YkwD